MQTLASSPSQNNNNGTTTPRPTPPASGQSEYARFRACDECRRRKIKCDGRISGCRHCVNTGVHCIYKAPTRTPRKRASSSQSSSKHVPDAETAVNLEERLSRIERAVKSHLASRLSAVPPVTPASTCTPQPKQRALYHWKVLDEDNAAAPADAGLIEDFSGNLKFIGESSVFSLFLPRGMQWVCEKMGEPRLCEPLGRKAISEWSVKGGLRSGDGGRVGGGGGPWSIGGGEAVVSVGEEEGALPEWGVVEELVNDYFTRVNPTIPILSRPRFLTLLHNHRHNPTPRPSPSFLISLHTILALSLLSNPLTTPSPHHRAAAERRAHALFTVGHKHVPTVLFCNRDITGVQALLVTILYLWETQSAEGVFTLLGVAVSIGTEIGLHRCGVQLGLHPEEAAVRRNVFWAAYILDKDLCLRIGRPSSIADEDVTLKLPELSEAGAGGDFFVHRVALARLQSKVSRLLCSQTSVETGGSDIWETIAMLNTELEAWRAGCDIMSEEEPAEGCDAMRSMMALRLKLVYYACLGAINRPLCSAFDLAPTPTKVTAAQATSYTSTVAAARASVALISAFEARNLRLLRSTAINFMAAAVALFTHTLEDPLAPEAWKDVAQIERVAEFLRRGVEEGCSGVSEMFFLVFALARMAAGSVGRCQGDGGVAVGGEEGGGIGVGRLCRGYQ